MYLYFSTEPEVSCTVRSRKTCMLNVTHGVTSRGVTSRVVTSRVVMSRVLTSRYTVAILSFLCYE